MYLQNVIGTGTQRNGLILHARNGGVTEVISEDFKAEKVVEGISGNRMHYQSYRNKQTYGICETPWILD